MARPPPHTATRSEGEPLARVLAGIGGFVDGVGYLALFHLFTAHQSGNSDALGVALSGGDWTTAWRRLTSIGAFVVGVGLGTLLVERARRQCPRWSGTVVAVTEVLALAVALGIGVGVTGNHAISAAQTTRFVAAASALAGGMGIQSVLLRRVGDRIVRTTFVTGVLTDMMESLVLALHAPRGEGRRRPLRFSGMLGSVWLGYLAGAIAGGAAERAWSWDALSAPIAGISGIAVWLGRMGFEPTMPREGLSSESE